MKVPLIKSRNFSSHDIALKAVEVNDIQLYLTGYAHGHAQGLRDSLAKKFGSRFKGLIITSSNRAAYNNTVANAAENSHHIWRLDADKQLHVAYDCKPVGITLHELYQHAIATVRGEVYLNQAQGIVHIAPVEQEDEHWVQ